MTVLEFTTAASGAVQRLVVPYFHRQWSTSRRRDPRESVGGRAGIHPGRKLQARPRSGAGYFTSKPIDEPMNRFDIEVEGQHTNFVDGVMVGDNSPETTSGGKALKFYASVRLDVRRIETLKDGTDAVGNRTRVKVVKNKCLAEGTRVFDPVTGLTHRIEEIVDGRLPVHVVSADKNGELSVREVKSWFDQGEQEVIGLRLRDNTELWVTPDHKILTERGWRLAGGLSRGDRVARPRSFLGFGSARAGAARPCPAARLPHR